MTVQLRPVEPEVVGVAVEVLEDMLARAKSGELTGFVLCGEMTGGEVLTVEAGDFAPLAMVGQLEFAKARVMAIRLEKPPDTPRGDE